MNPLTNSEGRKLARALGCTHEVRSAVITRPDSQGYPGGETIELALHFGMFRDGRFWEPIMLGMGEGKRNVHRFDPPREWHPDILSATGNPERLGE